MVVYDSASIYLGSFCDYRKKICAIDKIIDALLIISTNGANTGNITEYDLDTGQTKIKTIYRSPQEIVQAIQGYEALKEHYINKLNGRRMRLIDGSNFKNPYGGYNYKQ